VANEEIKQQILNIGIRKLERATGVSHHTINRILKRKHARRKTLAKIVKRIRY
jgi:transposase-like protein